MLIMLTAAHVAATGSFRSWFLQARVSIIAALMAVGFQIWLGVDFLRFRSEMVFSFTMMFPQTAAILDVMAARRAMVDQLTLTAVKSTRKSRKKRK